MALDDIDSEFDEALKTSMAKGLLLKGLGIAVTLLSTPVLISEVGKEKFGHILLFTSICGLSQIFDLGFPYLVANSLSKYDFRDRRKIYREFYFSLKKTIAYFATIILTICLFLICLLLTGMVKFGAFNNQEFTIFIATLFICSIILVLGNLANKVLLAQRQYVCSANLVFWGIFFSNALAILLAQREYYVSAIGFILVAGPCLPIILFVICKLMRTSKMFNIEHNNIHSEIITIRKSLPYIITNLSNSLFSNLDIILISFFLSFTEVAEYGVVNKLFLAFYNLYLAAMQSIYSLFANLFHQNDFRRLLINYKKVRRKAFYMAFFVLVVIAFSGQKLISIWTSNHITPNLTLVIIFAIWAFVCILAFPTTILFLVAAKPRDKITVQSVAIFLNVSISIFSIFAFRTTYSPLIGSIIATTFGFYLPILLILKSKFERQTL